MPSQHPLLCHHSTHFFTKGWAEAAATGAAVWSACWRGALAAAVDGGYRAALARAPIGTAFRSEELNGEEKQCDFSAGAPSVRGAGAFPESGAEPPWSAPSGAPFSSRQAA